MHEVSLIVATLGERPGDLCSLLSSLAPQADHLREVIVVDQNPDPQRIPALLAHFARCIPVRCVRSEPGLSRARNQGLPLASGSIVAFPDDDCVYPAGLLEWVVKWFQSSERYDLLAVGVKDADGVSSGNRWPQSRCDIRPINAFRTTFSSSLFVRKGVAVTQRFDEGLGVGSGTPNGSGEETDYVLRLLKAGARARFDRTRNIIHPRRDMLSGTGTAARASSYGFGMGHLLRVHSLAALWMSFLGYNLARAACALGRANLKGCQLCIAQTKGLWNGYLELAHKAVESSVAVSNALHGAAAQPFLDPTHGDDAASPAA
jgi:glycosyltransferase involved in cell wall biosynthesis